MDGRPYPRMQDVGAATGLPAVRPVGSLQPAHPVEILLVDDDETFRSTFGCALANYGYRVIHARDGDEAIGKIESDRPSVIVLDIFMPCRDGFEVLSWINDAAIHTPVIVVSGGYHGRNDLLPLSVPLGADTFLSKPFSCAELDREIRRLVATADSSSPSATGDLT